MVAKKWFKKITACAFAGIFAASAILSGCGSQEASTSDDSKHYTYLLCSGITETYYSNYEDGPVQQYWMDKFGIDVEFYMPITGEESDYTNTLMATGEYADVVSTAYVSDSVNELYEEGVALDLTDLVEEYMPNYLALCEEMGVMDYVTNIVDGEEKILQIYNVADAVPQMWGGFVYRRDWIVKYGTNPFTGEAFTGSSDEDGNWTDDVVFPSGGTDPVYISDWEWMLDIFATALEEQGITDGYCMSLPYSGFFATGDLADGFGQSPLWQLDDDGNCVFGADQETFRAYLECMNTWYENGWIDPAFEEKSQDAFYFIDSASVYEGKVGLCYGLESYLGTALDSKSGDENDPANGIVYYGAQQPINDLYGDDSCKYHEPNAYYNNGLLASSFIITDKAEEKDLATLLTALDYLYTEEGAVLRLYGFSHEEQEELQDPTYIALGAPNGMYDDYTTEDGTVMHKLRDDRPDTDGLTMYRVLGREPVATIDNGRLDNVEHSVNQWTATSASGSIPSTISARLTSEQADENSVIMTNIYSTYMPVEVPKFITGEKDIQDDAQWQEFVDGLNELHPETYTDNINSVLD